MANTEIDYYAVLNVSQNASPEEIALAYRKYAVTTHPDRDESLDHAFNPPNGVDENSWLLNLPKNSRWLFVNKAYDVLSNPLRREIYNRYGDGGLRRGVPLLNGYFPPYTYHGDGFRTYNEVFGTFSPYATIIDAATNPPPLYSYEGLVGVRKKAKELTKIIDLDLAEILTGTVKRAKIIRQEFENFEETKLVTRTKVFFVKIPPGVLDGTKIVYRNEGDRSPIEDPSDVVFITRTKEHPIFKRRDSDLYYNAEISLNEAFCGMILKIETLDDRVLRYPVYEVVNHNSTIEIPNEGLPLPNNQEKRGSLFVTFSVKFPKMVPCEMKHKIEEFFKEIDGAHVETAKERIDQKDQKDSIRFAL